MKNIHTSSAHVVNIKNNLVVELGNGNTVKASNLESLLALIKSNIEQDGTIEVIAIVETFPAESVGVVGNTIKNYLNINYMFK